MVTIDVLPRVAAGVGWQWASLLLVPGPLLGASRCGSLPHRHERYPPLELALPHAPPDRDLRGHLRGDAR